MRALIFGVTGQDGSYLAELLLSKGYEVHGVRRRASSFNTDRIDHLIEDPKLWGSSFFLHYGDLVDSASIISLVNRIQPTEIYNLAAQSHVGVSFENPVVTADINALGALRILEAIRGLPSAIRPKYYQASTSEMFGGLAGGYLNEESELNPRSPYGSSKLFAYWTTKIYRDSYDMFASNGILFNHESPRRGENFVTRKVTRALTRIKLGLQDYLTLGNLDATRDWGHARDFAEGMWNILQLPEPNDIVISTSQTSSVREFVEKVAAVLEIKIVWEGHGVDEVGINAETGQEIVKVDAGYFRPLEVPHLQGDSSLASLKFNWQSKVSIDELVIEMVESDLQLAIRDKNFPGLQRY